MQRFNILYILTNSFPVLYSYLFKNTIAGLECIIPLPISNFMHARAYRLSLRAVASHDIKSGARHES